MNMPAFIHRDERGRADPVVARMTRPRDPGPAQEFHRWPLPGYVWQALERRYHSIFCSEPLLRLHGALTHRIEAWVLRREGRIAALLLFERRGRCAWVINEVFDLPADDLDEFAQAVFAHHPALTAVRITAVALEGRTQRYPSMVAPRSDDYVLALPESEDAWLASLSAQTREKIRYHWRRAQRRQPSLCFRSVPAAAIDDAQLRSVIAFNRARMQAKGRRFGMDEQEERRLCALMGERGQLSVIEIDGEIRAGLLCTLAGNDITMHVIAHDPAFDDLRLGFLCCVMTVREAIAQGLQRFHFLWGHYDYKTRLGGRRIELSQVLLLRRRGSALLHPQLVGAQWLCGLRTALLAGLRAIARRYRQHVAAARR